MKKGWERVPIAAFAKTGAGGTPLRSNKAFYEGGDIPWLMSGEVANANINQAKNYITKAGLAGSSAKLFPPDSVLVAMYGATAGEVGVLRFEAATNQAVCAILPSRQHVPEFLYYYLLYAKEELVSQAIGNAQPNISQEKIKRLEIPLPPLPEQKRIVEVLDKAFEGLAVAKANAEANLQNARELFEGFLKLAFAEIVRESPSKNLNEIAENLDRQRVPITQRDRAAGEIPYYGASGVVDYVAEHLFDEELLLVSEDGANLLARTYPIAFSISGKSWVNNHAHVLRFKERATQEFVRLYLNSISLEPFVSGMAQPKLNQAALNRIPIPFPELGLQEDLIEKSRKISAETASLDDQYRNSLLSIDQLKKSLLQKAFAGELT